MIKLFRRKNKIHELKTIIEKQKAIIELQKGTIYSQEKELNNYKDNNITLYNILKARTNLVEQTGEYPKRITMSKKIYTNLNRERIFVESKLSKGKLFYIFGMLITVKNNIEGWYVK